MIARLLSIPVLLYLLGYALFAVMLPDAADAERRSDAIVVLTGGPGRLARGVALMEEERAVRMFVSGVDPSVRRNELALAARADARLFACCVELGREAVDTRSNAEETAAWVRQRGYRSVRLITTDWHMPRARFELGRMLDDDVTLFADAIPSQPRFATLFTEYNKYLLRRAAVLGGW